MTRLIHAVLFSWATLAVARDAKQQPATMPVLNQSTSQGCFNKLPAGAESVKAKNTYISAGFCNEACRDANKAVAITSPDGCHCADTYPPESALVKDTQCNYPCSAYPMEACGGKDPEAYSVFNTGIELVVDNDDGKTEATTTISSITPPSTPLSSKLPSTTTDGTTVEDTTAVSTPTKGVAAEGTSADSTNDAQSTPSATGTGVPSAAAPRLSSPVGKFVRMFKVFFN
ncbi:WSC domain-containing protein [Fusarium keratoplasticum]|uniref:WSC domain-containing protein n=1 Tax=Fusarium keratoplasticum TaxID=1328300 RepID=A0ACC0QZ34_9HYPO|nr:WSC domain-containing protein [Fusarium keratoplasticum]KAI8669613.1 WSC domain-containing protein [Fusarium keratoplasticum]KAI8674207.1 WSC domain-containing protein [Fusarium keratoplasticum]